MQVPELRRTHAFKAESEVFHDPSIFFDKRALDPLTELSRSKDMPFFTSKEFSAESLREVSSDFGSMQRYCGGWLGPNRQASREVIMAKIRRLPISF